VHQVGFIYKIIQGSTVKKKHKNGKEYLESMKFLG